MNLLRYFAGEAWRVGGDMLPADTPHTLLYSLRVPVGVCAIITPWNFPLSIPVWKIAPALAAGCTVVHKPAEWSPLTATLLAEIMTEAGVPAGVVNLVNGIGEPVMVKRTFSPSSSQVTTRPTAGMRRRTSCCVSVSSRATGRPLLTSFNAPV